MLHQAMKRYILLYSAMQGTTARPVFGPWLSMVEMEKLTSKVSDVSVSQWTTVNRQKLKCENQANSKT
jgi:hypothetical protein